MRVLTILLRYGTTAYPDAERQIDEIFGRQLSQIDREVIVIDNALPPGVNETHGRRTVIGGDNTFREFSGFDRALAHVGPALASYDLVHFATDAFHTLYVEYLKRFDAAVLAAIAGRPACVGHIDCYNEPIEVLGFHVQHWLRTGFFFMPPTEVASLGTFVSVRETRRFFSTDPQAPFRAEAPLSRRYQEYLIDWITGSDIGQGVQWHSSFALDAEKLSAFAQKSHAIMNEQLFSARLRAMGCRLIDVTWLSARLERGDMRPDEWNTPWRRQLAGRDRDPVVVPAR